MILNFQYLLIMMILTYLQQKKILYNRIYAQMRQNSCGDRKKNQFWLKKGIIDPCVMGVVQ